MGRLSCLLETDLPALRAQKVASEDPGNSGANDGASSRQKEGNYGVAGRRGQPEQILISSSGT